MGESALMLVRLHRGLIAPHRSRAPLPMVSRGLALKNAHGPPKQKRAPKPILGTNKWTVDDRLSRSNKCDPYEQGGKPLPEEEAQMLLARGTTCRLSISAHICRARILY